MWAFYSHSSTAVTCLVTFMQDKRQRPVSIAPGFVGVPSDFGPAKQVQMLPGSYVDKLVKEIQGEVEELKQKTNLDLQKLADNMYPLLFCRSLNASKCTSILYRYSIQSSNVTLYEELANTKLTLGEMRILEQKYPGHGAAQLVF